MAEAALPPPPRRYDWFASHSLSWPSLACRWGPLLEQGPKKNRQRLYLSEQTDGSEPNRIILVNVDVLHPRTASADHLQGFAGQSRAGRRRPARAHCLLSIQPAPQPCPLHS